MTSLSFTDPTLVDSAKVGILAGSLIAGALGYTILRTAGTPDTPDTDGAGPAPAGQQDRVIGGGERTSAPVSSDA